MIASQHAGKKLLAAVQAQVSIAQEELAVGERGDCVLRAALAQTAFGRDDGIDGDSGLSSGTSIEPPANGERVPARVPGDHVAGFQDHRRAPWNPPQRLPGDVKSENQGVDPGRPPVCCRH